MSDPEPWGAIIRREDESVEPGTFVVVLVDDDPDRGVVYRRMLMRAESGAEAILAAERQARDLHDEHQRGDRWAVREVWAAPGSFL